MARAPGTGPGESDRPVADRVLDTFRARAQAKREARARAGDRIGQGKNRTAPTMAFLLAWVAGCTTMLVTGAQQFWATGAPWLAVVLALTLITWIIACGILVKLAARK